jgi:hypothetical protein
MFAETFLLEMLFEDKQIRMTNAILGMSYDGTYILLLRSFDIIKFKFYSWEIYPPFPLQHIKNTWVKNYMI